MTNILTSTIRKYTDYSIKKMEIPIDLNLFNKNIKKSVFFARISIFHFQKVFEFSKKQ